MIAPPNAETSHGVWILRIRGKAHDTLQLYRSTLQQQQVLDPDATTASFLTQKAQHIQFCDGPLVQFI